MTKPNSRAVIAAVLLLGALGAVAAETAVKSEASAERRLVAGTSDTPRRLVGLGCGPDHATLTAVEEDEFPAPCHVIDTPERLCGHTDAEECAAYLGEGY